MDKKDKKRYSAFTYSPKRLVNVLATKIKVSACKDLFPKVTLKEYNGIWDTGATHTAISARIVKECGLIPISKATINTANGTNTVNVYLIDLLLPNNVKICRIKASEFTALKDADMLIGMDVIGMGDFAISNYEGETCFSFRIPSYSRTDYVKQIRLRQLAKTNKVTRNQPCPCREREEI